MFSSYRAVSYMQTMPNGDRAAELFLDRWVPGWQGRVAALTSADPSRIARDTALEIILALEDVKRAVQPPRDFKRPGSLSMGPENISGWWTDAKRWLKRTVGDAWDTFTDTMKDAWDNLGDWNSLQDVIDNAQFILSTGGSGLGKAASRSAEEALTATLGPFLRQIGTKMGQAYGAPKAKVMKEVRDYIKDKANSRLAGEIAAEAVGTAYDLSLGYPPCVCEEACIKPVSDGLKKAGGIPAIIGNILAAIYPVIQLPQAPAYAPALYSYAEGLPLLPNAKLSDTKIVGAILNVISDEMDQKIGVPKSFDMYRPWLVDMVALGARGPATITDQNRYARWYFDHPDNAIEILSQADKVNSIISGLFEWMGKIERWANMAIKAYETGKKLYDHYEAVDLAGLQQSLSAAATELFDTETLEKVGGWAIDKARPLAERQLHKGVQRAIQELGLQKFLDQADLIASYTGRYVATRPTGDGNISGTASSFLTQWMPASIGLQARAKFGIMVQLWASMTTTEREKWKSAPENYWVSMGTNFPAWYLRLKSDPKVAEYVFQVSAPDAYRAMATASDTAWPKVNDSVREAMRQGDYPTLFFSNFKGRARVPKVPKPPNVLDMGWPATYPRPEGFSASPSQYYAWRQDVLDITDPKRFKGAYERYEALWKKIPAQVRKMWLKDVPKGPTNPPLVVEPAFISEALKRFPELRVNSALMSRKRFWGLVMLAKYPNSLKVINKEALQTAMRVGTSVTKALLSMPPKTVVGMPTLAPEFRPVSELSLNLLDYEKARQEVDMGAAAPTTKRSLAVPLALGGAGLVLLGLAQKR